MKHIKLEIADDDYELIREAAFLARTPIRRWAAIVALAAAQRDIEVHRQEIARHEMNRRTAELLAETAENTKATAELLVKTAKNTKVMADARNR